MAVREDDAVDELRHDARFAEMKRRVGRRIDEYAAATDPKDEARRLAVRIEAVARAEHREPEVGRLERGLARVRRRLPLGEFELRGDARDDRAVELYAVAVALERHREPLVDRAAPLRVEHVELEQLVELDRFALRSVAEISLFPGQIRPRFARYGVGELVVVRRVDGRAERLPHHRAQALRDRVGVHDEPDATAEPEEVVVRGELDLRERDAAPAIEQLGRHDEGGRDGEPERHRVLDRFGRDADLHRARVRRHVEAAAGEP